MTDEENKEEIENEYKSIVEIMAGMKFYDVYSFSLDFGITAFCTYRSKEQIAEVFDNKLNIYQVKDPDEIMEAFNSQNGIYCIELHQAYKSLKKLAEDLIISRMSGLMDKELGDQNG